MKQAAHFEGYGLHIIHIGFQKEHFPKLCIEANAGRNRVQRVAQHINKPAFWEGSQKCSDPDAVGGAFGKVLPAVAKCKQMTPDTGFIVEHVQLPDEPGHLIIVPFQHRVHFEESGCQHPESRCGQCIGKHKMILFHGQQPHGMVVLQGLKQKPVDAGSQFINGAIHFLIKALHLVDQFF